MCLIIECMYCLPTNHDISTNSLSHVVYIPNSNTEYRNGYSKEHPVIVNFWKVFDEFTEEHKKKFLSKFMEG